MQFAVAAVFLLLLRAQPAQAPVPQSPQPVAPAKPAEPDPLGRDSPRGCATGFLKAAEREDYALAGQYLNTQGIPARSQELAQKLKVVLDRGFSGNFADLPRTAAGDLQGGLPATRQSAGVAKTNSGTLDIVLERVQRGTVSPIWLFSAKTLEGVPRAFADVQTVDFSRHFPRFLMRVRFLSLPLWRWLAILLGLGSAFVGAFVLTRVLMPPLRFVVRRVTGERDDRRLTSLRTPLVVLLIGAAVHFLGLLWISLLARQVWSEFAKIFFVVGTAWFVIRFSDILAALSSRRLLLRNASDKRALLALIHRLFKIFAILITVMLLLRGAGVNVTAMLAGLGIGGVAIALAAQKTLENFFGGIAIIMREVLRVGDVCKIADHFGVIEDVGFGSTRIRTLDRTVVSVSNAQVSQTSIENYTMRDRFWFHHIFGLRYDTSAGQMRDVLAAIGNMLRTHSKVEADTARIRLIEFGNSSLRVEVFAYILENDYVRFLNAQEDLLLQIMDIVTASGTRLALPSQITYLDRDQLRKPA